MRQSNRRQFLAAGTAAAAALLTPGRVAAAPPAPPGTLPALGEDFLWGVATSGFQIRRPCARQQLDPVHRAGKARRPICDAVDF